MDPSQNRQRKIKEEATKASGSESTSTHPLLISEIVDNVFKYLGSDLVACFDVCQLWRSTVPPHNLRYQPTRSAVIVKDDMDTPAGGYTYLESIRKHPSFKTTKFSFRNAYLRSSNVDELLKINGQDMEELELCYDFYGHHMTARDLADLLKHRLPNLKILSLKKLPYSVQRANLFANNDDDDDEEVGTTLALTRIKVADAALCIDIEPGDGFNFVPLPHFLMALFAASSRLEEVAFLADMRRYEYCGYAANIIARTLFRENRLEQIRKLEFGHADPKEVIPFLANHLARGQLRTFKISNIPVIVNHSFSPYQEPDDVRLFLESQAESLECLELPIFEIEPEPGAPVLPIIPPMPNLFELKLFSDNDRYHRKASLQGALNYSMDFPRLRVLGLRGGLQTYLVDEIFPDPDLHVPCFTVEVLQEIPLGVNEDLMARIGRLFPNLTIMRTKVAYGCEHLLISIWKFCPNITELCLTFVGEVKDEDEEIESHVGLQDQDPKTSASAPILDMIFTGILVEPYRKSRPFSDFPDKTWAEIAEEIADFKAETLELELKSPSLVDMKKLKRLAISGSSTNLFVQLGAPREDNLTSIFAYSALLAMAKQLDFFQASIGIAKMSRASIKAVCKRGELKLVEEGAPGFDPDFVRLIRPGAEFEGVEANLKEWYSLS